MQEMMDSLWAEFQLVTEVSLFSFPLCLPTSGYMQNHSFEESVRMLTMKSAEVKAKKK